MRIAFIYAGGRGARLDSARSGDAPTEFFYGAIEAERRGHEVAVFDLHEEHHSYVAALYNVLLGGVTPIRTRGEHLISTASLLKTLEDFDVVAATSTSHANALGVWKRLKKLKPRLVSIHCGLVNFPVTGLRKRTTRWTLGGQWTVLFAEPERAEMAARFGLPPERLRTNVFGVDADFWCPGEAARDHVLSVGNDGRRDYETLLHAVDGLDAPVRIVTSKTLPEPLPSNVEHLRGTWKEPAVSDAELRDLYRRAAVVVVPLAESLQPSGQSVALQAMACGAPVVLTKTRGLWTGEDFVEGREILMASPSDARKLRHIIEGCLGDPAGMRELGKRARERVCERGSIGNFASRLLEICAT